METIDILLILSPLLIGGIIALINNSKVNNGTERVEKWIRKQQAKSSQKPSKFNRFIINPILSVLVVFFNWTDSLDSGLKNGIRVASTLYMIAIWLFLLYAAFIIIVGVALFFLIAYIILETFSDDASKSSGSVIGYAKPGTRVNKKTGIIQEDTPLGYVDTDKRVNPKTGKIQENTVFGWRDTDTTIDQETGQIKEDTLFGKKDTDTRIDPETGIIQKKGLFGWQNTDRRINPKTGKQQKNTVFGWVDE